MLPLSVEIIIIYRLVMINPNYETNLYFFWCEDICAHHAPPTGLGPSKPDPTKKLDHLVELSGQPQSRTHVSKIFRGCVIAISMITTMPY